MPEADPAYWAQMQSEQELQQRKREMENAAAVYNQMQRELTTYGRTLDDPQGARLTANTQEGLGPIAMQRKAAGDIAPGPQKGSGDRRRMAAGVSKASKARQKVASALHSVIDPANEAIDYYAGPHLGSALGRSAEAANYVVSASPGLGDAVALGQAGADYVDAMGAKDYGGAIGALGMGALNAIFIGPMAKNFDHAKAAKAYEALRKGASPEQVWQDYKIAFDSSGIPRQWVDSPEDFKLTPKGEQYAKGRAQDPRWRPGPASEAIHAPVTYENYPEMKDWSARVAEDGGVAGGFTPPDGELPKVEVYAPPGMSYPKNYPHGASIETVTAHELGGHGIDWIEGGSFGGMPGYIPKAIRDAYPGVDQYDLYRRLGGETWANMGAYRNSLPADQQAAISPYFDTDISFDPTSLRKYQEEYPRSMQISQQTTSGTMEGPFTFKEAFDPSVHRAPSDRADLKAPPPGKGGRKTPSRPISRFGMATEPAREGSLGKIAKPPGFGGNGGPNADELLSMAMDTPRRVSARGGYVGAPSGINTPEAEEALVADILSRLKKYKGSGTNFYDDFQNAIRDWTSSPQMAQKFANASGHTSNQMSPLPNTTHALKAMNQDAVGYPVKAGLYPNASGKKITEDFASGRMSADPKTGQYTFALLPDEHRPPDFAEYAYGGERAVKGRAVHDTWDKEAFGYARNAEGKQNAASDTEHNFMDRIYNKVVHAARRDPELRARLGTGRRTYERAQADLWDIERRKKEKFDVLPAHQIMQENSALTQVAAIPGKSTGISRDLLEAPLDVKNQYTDEMFDAFSDGNGRNAAASALGMTPPMERGLGQWDGMMEPNRAVRYGIGTVGSGPDKVIDPASKTAMGAVRDWNQIAFGQEGGGITAGRADGATQATANLAPLGSPMKGQSDYVRTFKAVADAFGPDWQHKVVVQPGKNGEAVLKNISYGDYTISNEQFQQLAQKAGMALSPGGTQIRSTGFNKKGVETFGPMVERDVANDFRMINFGEPSKSPHVPDVWGQVPQFQNPDSYHRLFDDTRNNPKLKGTFDREIIPKLAEVQQVANKWERDHGIPANTVIDRVRRIITEAGPSWPNALDAAVKKGIIPAFAGAALLGGAADQFGGVEGGVQ